LLAPLGVAARTALSQQIDRLAAHVKRVDEHDQR
jgi:hypothetical protein